MTSHDFFNSGYWTRLGRAPGAEAEEEEAEEDEESKPKEEAGMYLLEG